MAEYGDVAEKAMQCLDDGFESAMTVMILPESLRRQFRTTNYLERLNSELKRRSKVIGIFPNTTSLCRLMGSVLIDQNAVYTTKRTINFRREDLAKLENFAPLLKQAAIEQHKLIAA